MTFKDKLNEYIKAINYSSKELSIISGVSESVISRYRSGERTPKINSKHLKRISDAIENLINEKNITKYNNINIYEELSNIIINNDSFNYESFSKNFNELIITLKININEMSKAIAFDSSHISRIRYGKARTADPMSFCNKVSNFITSKYGDTDSLKKITTLIGKEVKSNNLFALIFDYLVNNKDISKKKDYINDFLNNLNDFDLNDYIKIIKFDELKVPTIPFYKAKNKTYYGLSEMKKGELDFFKAVLLSKSSDDIFMCSDMPMEDMACDIDFGKKWMFAIAMCLKKGLHLNIIHNLDRPFNEMMLGLESWIPIYMTGQVSPFYLKDSKNSVYGHLNYVSGNYILYGECIKGYHEKGKYYLTSNQKELDYYKTKSNFLLKKANSLMDIYNEKNINMFQTFLLNDEKINGNRTRLLNSPPIFTISDELLDKILKRNKLSKEDIEKIKNYKVEEEKHMKKILKNNKITDIIHDYSNTNYENNNIYLSLENIFYDKKIKYLRDEYFMHLKSTLNYNNKNYKTICTNENTFNNISITIIEDNYVIISKNKSPVIHFIIRHKKLTEAIKNFKPLVIEKNK